MDDWLKIETPEDMAAVRAEVEEEQRQFLDEVPFRLAYDLLAAHGMVMDPGTVSELAGRLQEIFAEGIAASWIAFDAAMEARRIAAMH